MAQLPTSVLQELANMDDYDRTLALDRVARQHNMTVEQVNIQLTAFRQGGVSQTNETVDIEQRLQPQSSAQPVGQSPNYLQDAHKYRVRYDPSHDGQSRQSQIDHAILCQHCSAPLGIPAVRPIKVTCPNCMNDSVFNN